MKHDYKLVYALFTGTYHAIRENGKTRDYDADAFSRHIDRLKREGADIWFIERTASVLAYRTP